MSYTETIIEEILLENTGKALGDSGDAYGRHWEENRENGINKETDTPIEFYAPNENEIELEPIVNVYDFLTKHLDRTDRAESIEEILYEVCEQECISVYSIWEVQELFENQFLDEYVTNHYYDDETNEYSDDFYDKDIPYELQSSEYFRGYDWINTYNGEEFVSQTLQFMCFSDGMTDFVLLQVHGGCDVRGGYTAPKVFEINDIDYFLMYMDTVNTYCDCGLNNYMIRGYSEISNQYGDWLDKEDICNNTYVDDDGNLRCKDCNAIIMQYCPDF